MKSHNQKFILLILLSLTSICSAQFIIESPKAGDSSLDKFKPAAVTPKSTFVREYTGPTSITRTIKQGSKGNVWMASWEGIFKYDGYSFINITKEVSLSRFFSVLEDSKGNFWFGSIGAGVYYYDGKTFKNYTTKEGLVNNSVKHIYEDKSGNIWFATQGGVSQYDGNSFRNYTTKDGLLYDDTNWIVEDKTGMIWFASRGEVSLYNGKTFSNFTKQNGEPLNNIRTIIEDMHGDIWLGGQAGLWRYDDGLLTNISNKFVGFIYEDTKGNIWASIEGGKGWEVIRYEKTSLFKETLTATQIWTDTSMAFGISEVNNGEFWFGTLNGVCIYDSATIDCHGI